MKIAIYNENCVRAGKVCHDPEECRVMCLSIKVQRRS